MGLKYRFRENREEFGVLVLDENDNVIFSNSHYAPCAEWARDQFGLSTETLYEMYYDYKVDLDQYQDEEDEE